MAGTLPLSSPRLELFSRPPESDMKSPSPAEDWEDWEDWRSPAPLQARRGGGRGLEAKGAAWERCDSTRDGGREESESERFMMSLEERERVRRREEEKEEKKKKKKEEKKNEKEEKNEKEYNQ